MARQPSTVGTSYLIVYNLVQTGGWALILYNTILYIAQHPQHPFKGVYEANAGLLRGFQLAAFLEIVHAAIGIVRGAPAMAAMQWTGRSHVLFAVLGSIPELWQSPAAGVLTLAWAAIEVVRYPWYTGMLAGWCPAWLTWLRYTAFIPLYPLGVWAELMLMYTGLPYMAKRSLHSVQLPNMLNFGFNYVWFIKLYMFLWRQRGKRLRGGDANGSKPKTS